MLLLERIAERKIQEAVDRGEFNNLGWKGKPLTKDDSPRLPNELRTSYKILKNANVLPEEMQLRKEIYSIKELLDVCSDDEEIQKLTIQLNQKELRYHLLMQRRGSSTSHRKYQGKILNRFRPI